MTQKLTPEVVVQLNDLPGFPARPNTTPPAPDRWILGDWLVECHVNPEAPDFASLPLTDNRVGDVRVSLADQAWYIWDGAVWQPMAGGGGGGVASVSASAPLSSSGGFNPTISLTGIVDAAHGGTGIAASGAAGNVLTSTGAGWASSPLPASVTSVGASAPLSSSGGTTPTISIPSWPANAAGALTNNGAGVLSWAPDAGGTVTSVSGSGGTTGMTLSGGPITTVGTLTLGGTLAIANGGTGQTTASAAFAALSPLTTKGDVLGFNTANARIPVGSDGQVLTADSTTALGVKWAAPSTGTIGGSGTATQLAYFTGSSTIGSEAASGSDALTWDATNNALGIRVVSASLAAGASLDVASGQVAIPDGSAAAPALAFRDNMSAGLFSPANDVVGVAVSGTEIARLQQYGAGVTPVFLLGTTTPIGAISGSGNISVDSSDPSAAAGVVMLAHGGPGTSAQEAYRGGQFAGVRSRGTKTSPSAVGAGDGLWNAVGVGYTNASAYNYGALVTFKAEEAYTSTASGARIEFHTTANGTSGIATLGSSTTERMRIANDGKVFIGGVSTTNTHTFNVGTNGTDPGLAVASGGKIHYYGGSAVAADQILIGDPGNFEKKTLTAGTGISITSGVSTVTIAATGAAASTTVDIPTTAQEALNAGDLVCFVNDAGTPRVRKADATNTDARLNPVGFAVAAAALGAAVTVRVAGVADVPAARFDVAPGVANVGQRVFVSTTSGQITLTAPSASGDVLQRAGVLVDGGANPKVLVQIGDPTLL